MVRVRRQTRSTPWNSRASKPSGPIESSRTDPYVDSNDDCKHPIPGETIVLAALDGPGIVTHLWLTVADNEFAWPRLLRLRV